MVNDEPKRKISLITIVILIIVVLVSWEIFVPYIDSDLAKPSDIFDFLDIPENEIEASFSIKDLLTNEVIPITFLTSEIQLESGHTYQVIVNTNAPYRLINEPYEIVVKMEFHNETTNQWEFIWGDNSPIPFSSLWSDTFKYNLALNPIFTFAVTVFVYTPSGIEIYFPHVVQLTKIP